MNIDNYAYTSKLLKVNPIDKVIFSIFTLIITLAGSNIFIYLLILFINTYILIKLSRTNFKVYFRLLRLPFMFLILGIIPIAINISKNPMENNYSIKLLNHYLLVSKNSINVSLNLFFKSMSCISSLYFLSLTTPLTDIIYVLKKAKVPVLLVEMMVLIYRFIFIILESFNEVKIAQRSRLGYVSLRISFNSMAKLISSTLIKSIKKSNDLFISLENRLYNGSFNVLDKEYIDNKGIRMLFFFIEMGILVILIGAILI